jgi:hypothetical protein
MTTMSICSSEDQNPTYTEAYYEEQANQEEVYLEETEEEMRVILVSYDPTLSGNENLSEQREDAAEELITGDSDDPPMSEESIDEMLSITSIIGECRRV